MSHCGCGSNSHDACMPHEGGDSCVRSCRQTPSGSLQQTKVTREASLRIPFGAPLSSNRCHNKATITVSPTCSSEPHLLQQDLEGAAREDQQKHRRSNLRYRGLAARRPERVMRGDATTALVSCTRSSFVTGHNVLLHVGALNAAGTDANCI